MHSGVHTSIYSSKWKANFSINNIFVFFSVAKIHADPHPHQGTIILGMLMAAILIPAIRMSTTESVTRHPFLGTDMLPTLTLTRGVCPHALTPTWERELIPTPDLLQTTTPGVDLQRGQCHLQTTTLGVDLQLGQSTTITAGHYLIYSIFKYIWKQCINQNLYFASSFPGIHITVYTMKGVG